MELRIGNDLSELERLIDALDQFAAEQQLPSPVLFTLNLCLEELVTNTINYGYSDEQRHTIDITVWMVPGQVCMRVVDDGRAFDLIHDAPEPNIPRQAEQATPGGLGIHLVKTMMDQVTYERLDGLNVVTLCKQLDGGQA